ncbi:heterokaryon incompatibility protein-domain-containing protein, partial [Melanogaster broomeanus]
MPAHLIYLPTKEIIGRGDIKALVLTQLKEHLNFFGSFESDYERECAIGSSLRNVTKYAILSHRWLNDGEPSFRDMLQKKRLSGPGHDKLMRFCQIANHHKCIFAWSDTCCINKESSTELEEAIRSMFRWYSNAYVCIAYLADSSSPEDFKKDAWFTRGWTLQELLAPKVVRFFGVGWQHLGDRDNIEIGDLISSVTNIPVVDLQRFSPGRDRVHEKMRWAARRKTTRVEDVAYCLLGIFDVSLTVAYGEGKRAWTRLMEAIMQSCNEWQVFA